ncbi:MAG: glycoside hydrolase family 140 protein, partial [Saprospiraceae bacterium]|nr:glycoside hydrolase family 140 protein [Saprospiraceae bacterium]
GMKAFTELMPVEIDEKIRTKNDWLWRVSWHDGTGYGVVYEIEHKTSSLVKTTDGIHYDLVTPLGLDGMPNEATVRFLQDGTMCIMHRREEKDKLGYWGVSAKPYTQWHWNPMSYRLGGPDFLVMDDFTILAGTRTYGREGNKTSILLGNQFGNFKSIYELPSGGDCSYPTFVEEEDRVLMTYYSSHEGRAAIYLVEIPKAFIEQAKTPWLEITDNGRYLQTEDGTPFFWLGGTAWELLHRLNREEVIAYLDNRAAKGFTVIQTVALAELDGLNTPNAYGHKPLMDNDPTRLNDAYFKHVDFVFSEAERRGMYIGFLPTWGDKFNLATWGTGPLVFTPSNAETFGRLLAKRYKDRPNFVWILGGDRWPEDEEDNQIIRGMARGIRSVDTRHLITYHPNGAKSATDFFATDDWLQLDMIQSGHDRDAKEYAYVWKDRAKSPVRPVINGEPRYEDHPNKFRPLEHGWMDAVDVRQTAWWTMLAGAAGYTYGCHDIWQMWSYEQKPVNGARTVWYKALDLPGSEEVGIMRRFFDHFDWQGLENDQTLIISENPEDSTFQMAAISQSQDLIIAYVPSGKSIQVDLSRIQGSQVLAYWFNPRDGGKQIIGSYKTSENPTFEPWSKGWGSDFVLVVMEEDSGYSF